MATNAENLAAIKANILAQLATLSDASTRKLSYSIDGQSVSWTEYQDMLFRQLDTVNKQLQAARPFVVVSKGRS